MRSGSNDTEDPWARGIRPGYCYHSALSSYKTETLVKKWREGSVGAQQLATIAWELSFRDPDLALAEVKGAVQAALNAKKKVKKALRICLHHVADAEQARELFEAEGFVPDALHLSAFEALLADFLEMLPTLPEVEAVARLRRLGFLEGPVTNPMADGPRDSEAFASSSGRYIRCIEGFLRRIFDAPSLVDYRPEILEHLRRIYEGTAYEFLLERWWYGQVSSVDAFAAVPRLGWPRAEQFLGRDGLERLVRAFVAALQEPPIRFEKEALDAGWVPHGLTKAPLAYASTIAIAIVECERLAPRHDQAADVLLSQGQAGARSVIQRARSMPAAALQRAVAMLPYSEARATFERQGLAPTHPALAAHADAPPNMALLPQAEELLLRDPSGGCKQLGQLARNSRHPDHGAAFMRLIALAKSGQPVAVRKPALFQLGQIGDPRAASLLIDAASDPVFSDALILIFSALARVATTRWVPQLEALAAQHPGKGAEHALELARRRRGLF